MSNQPERLLPVTWLFSRLMPLGRPPIKDIRTKSGKINHPSHLVRKMSALAQTPLSVWTHNKFPKNPEFFYQKVPTSAAEEPPPLPEKYPLRTTP